MPPKMVDMTPPESADEALPSISLTHEHLKALGIKGANVGDQFELHGHARVTSQSQHEDDDGGPSGHIQLGMHKMNLQPQESASTNGQEAERAGGAKAVMDKALNVQSKTKAKGRK